MNVKVNITNRAGATFPVRRMQFDFNEVPEYWMNGSAGLTHFMTGLSALFPAGEKFFIESVRAVREYPAVKQDELLQKEISGFIGQEAMHTHEHSGFNVSAEKFGHNVSRLEKYTERVIQSIRKSALFMAKPFGVSQHMVDLIATTALEHFTATIASELLRNQHIQALMTDETMKTMWLWHAIEENEHKAVAYDVFEAVFGRGLKAYAARTSGLTFAMLILFLAHSYFVVRLLKDDSKLNFESIQDIYTYAYSPSKGIVTGMGKEMLVYFKLGYHPNDLDTTELINHWKVKLGL